KMREYTEKKETCGTICLKYLLFIFNFFFWLAGGAVMAVGAWTLAEKSDYISLLSSSTYSATAYILADPGIQVQLLWEYFILLLCIFLLEIIAGILAYIYYQQLSMELKQNLKNTMTQKYRKEGEESVTSAVDKLQQEFKCCGSNNYTDWVDSLWIKSPEANGRKVPDSCCKTITDLCGRRDHPSNIYKESGCITKLENFIQEHLKIIGAVGISIACVQIFGMIFTCCLYKSLKPEPY
ncbi:CD151 antigen, partial [Charadrius vociferus]